MKVILYMAITPNGMIAKENDDTDFVSKSEWKSFKDMLKKTGNLVIGGRTYKIMEKNEEFSKITKSVVVVVSRDFSFKPKQENHFVARTPKDALSLLKKHGFGTALVAGGGKLNASFLKEGLVDELFLDIEPVVFGKGIGVFAEQNFEAKLKLLKTKKLSGNEIQLHYKVMK